VKGSGYSDEGGGSLTLGGFMVQDGVLLMKICPSH
jgi:hypothetical protein